MDSFDLTCKVVGFKNKIDGTNDFLKIFYLKWLKNVNFNSFFVIWVIQKNTTGFHGKFGNSFLLHIQKKSVITKQNIQIAIVIQKVFVYKSLPILLGIIRHSSIIITFFSTTMSSKTLTSSKVSGEILSSSKFEFTPRNAS